MWQVSVPYPVAVLFTLLAIVGFIGLVLESVYRWHDRKERNARRQSAISAKPRPTDWTER